MSVIDCVFSIDGIVIGYSGNKSRIKSIIEKIEIKNNDLPFKRDSYDEGILNIDNFLKLYPNHNLNRNDLTSDNVMKYIYDLYDDGFDYFDITTIFDFPERSKHSKMKDFICNMKENYDDEIIVNSKKFLKS